MGSRSLSGVTKGEGTADVLRGFPGSQPDLWGYQSGHQELAARRRAAAGSCVYCMGAGSKPQGPGVSADPLACGYCGAPLEDGGPAGLFCSKGIECSGRRHSIAGAQDQVDRLREREAIAFLRARGYRVIKRDDGCCQLAEETHGSEHDIDCEAAGGSE